MAYEAVTAIAHPNIAFIKYWGNRNDALRLPSNSSLSLTMDGLETKTMVRFDRELKEDRILIDGQPAQPSAHARVVQHLDRIRTIASIKIFAQVASQNSFPAGAGIASSASAFASLTLASLSAAGLQLDPQKISQLARQGSGSACRSIFGGYVQWSAGEHDEESYAEPIAPKEHWHLVDLVAVVSREHKPTGSTTGHMLAHTSPLQPARVADTVRRLSICKQAILERNFHSLAMIAEQDAHLMHAVMMTSAPPLIYWLPETVAVIKAIGKWRQAGLDVFYTIDAGPNIHCICTLDDLEEVRRRLSDLTEVDEILEAHPGGPARIINSDK